MTATGPFGLTPEEHARLTPEERARLTPEERDRLDVLERGQAQGTLTTIQLDELHHRTRLYHFQYLLSFGQRMQVRRVDETEQSRVWDRHRQWQLTLERTRATVHPVDRKIARLGVQFAEGVVNFPKVGKLLAEQADDLKTVLDYAARLATATEAGAEPAAAPPMQETAQDAAAVAVPTPAAPVVETHDALPPLRTAAERRAAVNAFLKRVFNETGYKANKDDIRLLAGHKTSSEFGRWQRDDSRTRPGSHVLFSKILAMPSDQFVRDAKRQRSMPDSP